MRVGGHAWLLDAWTHRGPVAWLLRPLSLLFSALVNLRRTRYRLGLAATPALPVPVIVVGNVMVGGVGKTPVVMALVAHLQSRGLRVGVISRGYGRSTGDCREVLPTSPSAEVGDEALLIRRRTGAPVFVARQRVDAAQALLQAYPGTQVVLSDDGLQHLALPRDVDLCVFDNRGVGNGWMLPAGPLREPWPRRPLATGLRPAPQQWVLHTGDRPAFDGYRATRRLAQHALAANGTRVSLASLAQRAATQPLRLIAVAGIAQPEVFFKQLRQLGLQLEQCIALPDHFSFDSWKRISDEANVLICTEKDAVKLWPIEPQALAVPLQVEVEPELLAALEQVLESAIGAKLSSKVPG